MKKCLFYILIIFLFQFPIMALAISWEIYGPCDSQPARQGEYIADLKISIGEITIELLDYNKIPYEGTELSIVAIDNSPTGLDAMEVISDTEMRAYGWCYSVNGFIPDKMANHVYPQSQNDMITWFYGFYTNKDNKWSDTCIPSYTIKAPQFCGK